MADQIQWLNDIHEGPWVKLANAVRAGIPVPAGYVVLKGCTENDIRNAYDELKAQQYTHYVAVRSASHAQLDVIGNDPLIHTWRGFRAEEPQAPILIQRMVNSAWCGKASWEGKNLRIRASEGLLCLDPDNYLFNPSTNKCVRRTLYQHPRKVFRAVDGRTRTMEITGDRYALEVAAMAAIAELAKKTTGEITWVLEDGKAWLISC